MRRQWTDEEHEFLLQNHAAMNNRELARALKRPVPSIVDKKCRLGLGTGRAKPQYMSREYLYRMAVRVSQYMLEDEWRARQ